MSAEIVKLEPIRTRVHLPLSPKDRERYMTLLSEKTNKLFVVRSLRELAEMRDPQTRGDLHLFTLKLEARICELTQQMRRIEARRPQA